MDLPLDSTMVMQVVDEVKPLIPHCEPPVYRRGSIKRLTVKNFLTFGEIPPDPRKRKSAVQPISFEFEPSINIVSGPNGFGKSSLVNAIALCCGSSAVFLRRGKTYKDLIHRGEKIDQAEIELHLRNGPDESSGVTRFARVIHKQNNKNAFYVNGNKLNTFGEYRARLREDFRIQPENLTIFLLQDRIADLADLEPPKLLRCAEESLSREVLEMHDDLISRREKWADKQQELATMREEEEPQIIKQNETEKDARKLRDRNATFERMGAVRLKLLVQSVQAIESEKSALEEDLRVQETNFKGWAAVLSAALGAIKNQAKTLKEKPPQFPPTGRVRDCLARLDELARIDGDSRNEVVKLQRQMESLQELTGVSPEDQREKVRLEIVHEEHAITQKESIEVLTQKKHDNDERIEEMKGDLETKMKEWDDGKQQLTEYEERRNVLVQELKKVPGTKQQFKSRLDTLKRNGLITEDVVKVWEAINDEENIFDGHVYGPLFLYIRPKKTHKDAVKVMETLLGIKTLQMFLVDSKEVCKQMIKRFIVKEGYKINVAFIRNQTESTEMPKFDDETMADFRKRGFADVLDKMYEAPEVVRRYFQQAFSSRAVLVSRRHRVDSVADLIEDWKAKSGAKDRLSFATSEYLYGLVKLDDHTITIHEQPVKEAQLLRYEAATDVKLQDEQRKKLEEELAAADQNLSQFKAYLKELGENVKSLEEELAVLEDESQQIHHDIDEQEESARRISELHETLLNLSQVDVKPSSLRLKDLGESIRKENRKRLNLLCSNSEDAVGKLQETTQTLQDVFGEIVKKTGLLLHTSRSHARVLGYGKKRKETDSIIQKLKAEKEELEAAFAERKQRARMLTNELFCDRGRTAEEVKNLYQQLKALKTSAALSKELRSIHATIMAPGTDKINLLENESTQRMELAKALEDSRYKRLELEFELRKLQLSQTALRAQWLSKLQQDIDDINKSFGAMLNRMDYDGSVELVKPGEPVEYDQYGLKLKVRFREDEEEAELGPNTQSGGQRVVAIAVFLLALQRRSDAPFRIVDEINQGMDASHERKVFQLMIDAAQSYAQSGGQIISCSPKISPNFTAQNFSVLNFIFLMKTDLKQDAKFFRMEDLRPKFIEQTMLHEENDD